MGTRIKFDCMNDIQQPTLILATRSGKKLGSIPAYNIVFKDCLNSCSEVSFRVSKFDNGRECVLWGQLLDFKLIYCREWDLWFEIYVETNESDSTVKNVTGKTICEAELSQINLYNIEINTETDISREEYKNPTVFYDEEYPENSLLNRLMEKAPHYTIEHVDSTLARIQKTFSFDGVSLYDAFQEIAEEVGCLFLFDSGSGGENSPINRKIRVYDLYTNCGNCGYRTEYEYTGECPQCGSGTGLSYSGYGVDTGIFISADALADEITYSTNTDSVKNCFKVEGGDDMINAAIRNCNPNGSDYIWYFTDEVKMDMSDGLKAKLEDYEEEYRDVCDTAQYPLNTTAINEYNAIVEKYSAYNSDLQTLSTPVTGYSQLMEAYYNTIDLAIFLRSGLMPLKEDADTTAEELAGLLYPQSLFPVFVTGSVTKTTADNAVLSAAKTLIGHNNYNIEITNSFINSGMWAGYLKITNSDDSSDTYTKYLGGNIYSTADSSLINSEGYIRQRIAKILYDNETDDFSIAALFRKSADNFKAALKGYCLDSLSALNDACQAVLDILISQGAASVSSDLYEKLYEPYYQKLEYIQSEILTKENEINSVTGVYGSDGEIVQYGMQTYIISMRDNLQRGLNIESRLGSYWTELCSYRREDKYSNPNYISDGLNTAELFKKARELLETAATEIHKSGELQHSISSSLKNLLAAEEFRPLTESFAVGNWLRIRADNAVYKLRLIEYEIDYEDLDNISVEFSDVLKVADAVSDLESIVKQASSIASSYDSVAHQASQGSTGSKRLNDWVDKGLSLTNMRIVSGSDNQEITWDNHGFLMREYLPVTDAFSDKQLKIINKGLYVTDDAWQTSRAAIGNFMYYDPRDKQTKEAYGVIADTLIGNLILGENVGIYNSGNDITLDTNGFMITNKNNSEIGNPVTITMNPNNDDGVFVISSQNGGNLIQVDINGELNIGDGKFIVDNTGKLAINQTNFVVNSDGSLNIGSGRVVISSEGTLAINHHNFVAGNDGSLSIGNGTFTVDSNGNARLNNIICENITLGAGCSISWDKIDGTDTITNTASSALDSVEALANGDYTSGTFISGTKVSSPTIEGGEVIGGTIRGGEVIGADAVGGRFWAAMTDEKTNTLKKGHAYLELGDDATNFGDLSLYAVYHPETSNEAKRIFRIYDDGSSATLCGNGDGLITFGTDTAHLYQTWDFLYCTVTNLSITFG